VWTTPLVTVPWARWILVGHPAGSRTRATGVDFCRKGRRHALSAGAVNTLRPTHPGFSGRGAGTALGGQPFVPGLLGNAMPAVARSVQKNVLGDPFIERFLARRTRPAAGPDCVLTPPPHPPPPPGVGLRCS